MQDFYLVLLEIYVSTCWNCWCTRLISASFEERAFINSFDHDSDMTVKNSFKYSVQLTRVRTYCGEMLEIILSIAVLLSFMIFVSLWLLVVISNSTVIFTVIQNGNLRRPSNYGMLAISVTNLFYCGSYMFLALMKISHSECNVIEPQAARREFRCFLGDFVVYISIVLLMLAPVAVAVDRYIAICHPFFYLKKSKSGDTKWIFVICLMLAFMFGAYSTIVYLFLDYENSCLLDHLSWFSPVAVTINLVLYIKIFLALKRSVSITWVF